MTHHHFLHKANVTGSEPTYAQPYPDYSRNQLTSLCPSQTQFLCRVLHFKDNGCFIFGVVVYCVKFAHCASGGDVRMLMCNIFSMTGGLHPPILVKAENSLSLQVHQAKFYITQLFL